MMCDINITDWQLNKCVLERNKYMFENSLATDVVFDVGNEEQGTKEKIEAHKYVLISASPVFWAMFTGQFKEPDLYDVPDVDPESFKEMLRFIYYEDVKITGENVMQLLYLSKKYMIKGLAKLCTGFLEYNINIENVCTVFEQCILFDEDEVIEKCKDIIQENTSKILHTDSFRNISQDTLVKIVEMEKLFVEEVELFQACMKWGRVDFTAKSNLPMDEQTRVKVRTQLGQAFFKIRFTQMNLSEFANVVVPSGILTMQEENLCFRHFTQDKKTDNIVNIPFTTTPRKGRDSRFIWLAPDTEFRIKDAEIWTKTNVVLHLTNLSNKTLTIAGLNGIKNSNVSKLHFRVSDNFSSITTWRELLTLKCRHEDNPELNDYIIFEQTSKVPPLSRIEFELQIFGKLTVINQQSCKFEQGNASFNVVSDLLYIPISGVLCSKDPSITAL